MSGTRRGRIKRAGAVGAIAAAGGLSQASASPQLPDNGRREPPKTPQVRCVVTGRDKSGKSVIVSNALAAPVTVALLPGVHFYRLWGSDSLPALPSDGTPTLQPGYFPPKNGFRFGWFTLPPAASKKVEPVTPAPWKKHGKNCPGFWRLWRRIIPACTRPTRSTSTLSCSAMWSWNWTTEPKFISRPAIALFRTELAMPGTTGHPTCV